METREIEGLVGELETRVDRLRALYEQYFMGIEKMAPAVPQKDVERRIQVLRKEQIRNTAVRFRFQMILQRYNTYQTHWGRICRQIEEGTYKRDLLRAQRRFAPKPTKDDSVEVTFSSAPPAPVEPEPAAELKPPAPAKVPEVTASEPKIKEIGLGVLPKAPPLPPAAPGKAPAVWRKADAPAGAAKPNQPAPTVVPARAPPPLPPQAKAAKPANAPAPPPLPSRPSVNGGDLTDDRLRQIYSQYVQSLRAQKESTAAVTYDAMAKSLRESSQKLKEKHGKSVDFEVTVKDGKTILRPVVKR